MLSALCVPLICLPIRNQPIKFAHQTFDHLKGLDLADSGEKSEHRFTDRFRFLLGITNRKN